jgi:hypothetical protein
VPLAVCLGLNLAAAAVILMRPRHSSSGLSSGT